MNATPLAWPALPLESWRDTLDTLHMYTQIVGKVRLASGPIMNEWWNVPLYVTTRGLTTTPMPHGARTFEIDFDFLEHELIVNVSDGLKRKIALMPRSVAEFYADLMGILDDLDLGVTINTTPSEVPNPIDFDADREHASYDAAAVGRFFEALRRVDVVFKEFRAGYTGKCSPVHFFWGSFDLAVTRFSGKVVPVQAGADLLTRIAYDEEVSSVGFWPGGEGFDRAAFYSYASPEPPSFAQQAVTPASAYYHDGLHEFILPYDDVRGAPDPKAAILSFAESTYEAAATLGGYDRAVVERPLPRAA